MTLGQFQLQSEPRPAEDWLRHWYTINIQAVPGFVGHSANDYIEDPYPWLPPCPSKELMDDVHRAVLFVPEGSQKIGQKYADVLLTLTHDEYRTKPFPEVMGLCQAALNEYVKRRDAEHEAKRLAYHRDNPHEELHFEEYNQHDYDYRN